MSVPRRLHRVRWTCALLGLCALAGCARRDVIQLHYLSGFVPGTHDIFLPAHIAVAPIGGDLASGVHEVGGIYDPTGHLEKGLQVADAGAVVHDALMTGLADAGLKPIALDAPVSPGDLSAGVDVMLTCNLQQLMSEKNFAAQQTIHGQYFTMSSRVGLKCTLQRRDGSIACENELTGVEEEPPKPVGAEVFLPLESDPAESLSVALSRAVGALVLDPQFRAAFPPRAP